MYESFFALFFDLAIEMNERERVLNFCSSRTRRMVWFLVFYMRMRKKVSFFTPMP
jgi:hypothetical protein